MQIFTCVIQCNSATLLFFINKRRMKNLLCPCKLASHNDAIFIRISPFKSQLAYNAKVKHVSLVLYRRAFKNLGKFYIFLTIGKQTFALL